MGELGFEPFVEIRQEVLRLCSALCEFFTRAREGVLSPCALELGEGMVAQ